MIASEWRSAGGSRARERCKKILFNVEVTSLSHVDTGVSMSLACVRLVLEARPVAE
jgi:hypothetical protein